MRGRRSIAAALVATSGLIFASPAFADIIHVPADFPTIQGAINASVDADEIIVAPGVYHEAISLVGKAITLRSAQGPHVTIIDATGLDNSVVRCVSEEGPDTIVDGFTLTGGTGSKFGADEPSGGGMICAETAPTVKNCYFVDNSGQFGGGIYNWGGAATIINCTFRNNSANTGGGVGNSSSGPVPIINCLFVENSGTAVVDFLGGGPALLTNCTIVANSGGGSAGGVFSFGAQLYNCVVWGNTPYQIEGFGKVVADYSNIQGGWPGEFNFDIDPNFAHPDDGDYRIVSPSSCIDTGYNDALPEGIETDLDGNPRFLDDPDAGDIGFPPVVDRGAYEYQVPLVWYVDDDAPADPGPGDPDVSDPNEDGGPEHPFDSIQEAIDAASNLDQILVVPGTYTGTGNRDLNTLGKSVHIFGPGGAANTIIDCQGNNDDPHRGFGFELAERPETIVEGLTIRNGFADDGGGLRCLEGATPTIRSCVIEACQAPHEGGGLWATGPVGPSLIDCLLQNNVSSIGGGGLVRGGARFDRCVFTENDATDAAGLACMAMDGGDALGVDIIDSTFSDHQALAGAAISVTGADVRIAGTTIVNNVAAAGGGIALLDGSIDIINTLFAGNHGAISSGAMWVAGGQATIVNTTMTMNTAKSDDDGAAGLTVQGGDVVVANSIIYGNDPLDLVGPMEISYSNTGELQDGPGNISVDPKFVDPDDRDLQLQPGSPCIDAADNTVVPPGTVVDLAGQPRFVDDPDTEDTGNGEPPIVDIGAYEFQGPACPWDLDGDGNVGAGDLILLLGSWGDPYGTQDLIELLGNWGPCP